MRKVLVLLLALCLMSVPALAEDMLVKQAVELGKSVDTLCEDAGYVGMMIGGSNSGVFSLIETWASGNHDQPRLVVRADTTNLLQEMMAVYGAGDVAALPDSTVSVLNRKMPTAMASMLNAFEGAEAVAASSIATSSVIFAGDVQGEGLIILLYDDAAPVMAGWYSQNGAVYMQATFVAQEELAACQSADDVAAWFREMGWQIPCEEIAA